MRPRASLPEILTYTKAYTEANKHRLVGVELDVKEDSNNLYIVGRDVQETAEAGSSIDTATSNEQDYHDAKPEALALQIIRHHIGTVSSTTGNFVTSKTFWLDQHKVQGKLYEGGRYSASTVLYREENLFGLKLLKRSINSENVLVKEWKPSKLTRLLSKLGIAEHAITDLATRRSNKPQSYSLEFTNSYIPEHYRLLAEAQSLTSCMSKASHVYELEGEAADGSDLHPTMAYENSPNVMLGLVKDNNSDKDYPYVARFVVVCEEGSVHTSRVYGLERSEGLVRGAGIEIGGLEGGKLTKVGARGSYLMPYIDGSCDQVDDVGNYFLVDDGGNYTADSEGGLLEEAGVECEHCGDQTNEEDVSTMYVRGDALSVCEGCRSDACYIDRLDEHHHYDDCVELASEYYGGRWGSNEYDISDECTHTSEGYVRDEDCVEFEGEDMHVSRRDAIEEDREQQELEAAEAKEEARRIQEEEAA